MTDYDTGWFKSSRSAANSDACVEVRLTDRSVLVRDSKNPESGHLAVDHMAWASFLTEVAGKRRRPH